MLWEHIHLSSPIEPYGISLTPWLAATRWLPGWHLQRTHIIFALALANTLTVFSSPYHYVFVIIYTYVNRPREADVN